MNFLPSSPDWMSLLTPAAAQTETSLIREMFARLKQGDIISFAGGMPDTQLFPYSDVEASMKYVLEDTKRRVTALNYGPSEGYLPLRQWVAKHMQSLGVDCESDNILLTSGGQQALDLICRSMILPGDSVIVTAPTYLGALQILRTYGTNVLSVPVDAEGPMLKPFQEKIESGPKFVYLVSDFSNPTGLTISKSRRKALIKIARSRGVPIVDDAAYQQLRFEGVPIAPMMALDQNAVPGNFNDPNNYGGVIHVGTFSKTMMPGLRVGWIAAPKNFLQAVVPLKQATDLHSPLLNQMVTYEVVSKIYETHIERLCETYERKRDAMILAMGQHFPEGLNYSKPEGGMFVWVTLPEGANALELLNLSMEEAKVAYIPGAPFFAQSNQGKGYCRFSFSGQSEGNIREGIKRFGRFISSSI